LNTIWCWKHSWLGHVLKHDSLPKDILEGKMIGKPTTEWKRWNLLSDLAEKGKHVALRRRAANRKEWQELKRAGTHTAASQQNT